MPHSQSEMDGSPITAEQLVTDYLKTTGARTITFAEVWRLAEELRKAREAEHLDSLLFGMPVEEVKA